MSKAAQPALLKKTRLGLYPSRANPSAYTL